MSVVIDGQEYDLVKSVSGSAPDVRIVILQRGWVMVGRFSREGSDCVLRDASVIRLWGTEQGLGQLAENGPTSKTKLDRCHGKVQFDWLTVVAPIGCKESSWASVL